MISNCNPHKTDKQWPYLHCLKIAPYAGLQIGHRKKLNFDQIAWIGCPASREWSDLKGAVQFFFNLDSLSSFVSEIVLRFFLNFVLLGLFICLFTKLCSVRAFPPLLLIVGMSGKEDEIGKGKLRHQLGSNWGQAPTPGQRRAMYWPVMICYH